MVRSQGDLIDWCPFRKRKKPRNSLTGTDSVCRHTEKRPCDNTVRRRPPAQQGERSQQKPRLLELDLELPKWWGNKLLLFFKPPCLQYLVMVRQLKLTSTEPFCNQAHNDLSPNLVMYLSLMPTELNSSDVWSYQCPSHSPWLFKNLSIFPFCFYAWSSVAFL